MDHLFVNSSKYQVPLILGSEDRKRKESLSLRRIYPAPLIPAECTIPFQRTVKAAYIGQQSLNVV